MKARAAATLLAVVWAGCVSGGGSAGVGDGTTVVLGSAEGEGASLTRGPVTLSSDPSEGAMDLQAGLQESWDALQRMVTTLDLPVAAVEAETGTLLVRGRMPRLDGRRMSRWFDCGRDLTGSVADRSTIDLSLQFRLEPVTSSATRVAYAVQATARPRSNSTNRLACTAEAALPEFLFEAIAAELGGAGVGG